MNKKKTRIRNEKQKEQHKLYMREYYKNNKTKREANNKRNCVRGLVKIPCTKCDKNISRNNMKRHERLKHPADQIQEEQIQEE